MIKTFLNSTNDKTEVDVSFLREEPLSSFMKTAAVYDYYNIGAVVA